MLGYHCAGSPTLYLHGRRPKIQSVLAAHRQSAEALHESANVLVVRDAANN